MNDKIISAVSSKVETEPYARKLGMRLLELEPGRAVVEMPVHGEMNNIFGITISLLLIRACSRRNLLSYIVQREPPPMKFESRTMMKT
jgi:hypothetical protein